MSPHEPWPDWECNMCLIVSFYDSTQSLSGLESTFDKVNLPTFLLEFIQKYEFSLRTFNESGN